METVHIKPANSYEWESFKTKVELSFCGHTSHTYMFFKKQKKNAFRFCSDSDNTITVLTYCSWYNSHYFQQMRAVFLDSPNHYLELPITQMTGEHLKLHAEAQLQMYAKNILPDKKKVPFSPPIPAVLLFISL